MIIWTELKNIYTSTFSNSLTPKMAKNHEVSVYFLTKSDLSFVSRTDMTPKFKCAVKL